MSPEHHHDDHQDHHADEDRWSVRHWDERYSSKSALWSGKVNAVVAAETDGLAPGRALDVGCGEGGDAIWLARQGWRVTGVDISQVALDRAAAEAEREGLQDSTRWEQRDLLEWRPSSQSFDLVTLGFMHLLPDVRPRVYAAMADAVASGGTFLVTAHHFSDGEVVPRPPEPGLFFEPQELLPDLPGDPSSWTIEVCERRPRTQAHPDTGEPVEVHDSVLRARRLPATR